MVATPAPATRDGAELTSLDGRSLPLVSAKLRTVAGGGLARVVLEQTFENPYDDTLRVRYKMPLPVDGAVSAYAFRIGARTVAGKVDRKESARARFEEAIASGRTAALLEQDKADIFTQEIGNIPPGQAVVAEITIDQRLAWTPDGEWEWRFPTVIGPRYISERVPEASARASHVELADGGVRARVHLELAIQDAIEGGRDATSPTHRLSGRGDGTWELASEAGAKLDRDVVVRWRVATRAVGLSVRTARPEAGAPNGRHAYALLSLVPPHRDAGVGSVPRDLVVLLDTSGSMSGPPLEKAKRVVASLIDSLEENDTLELSEFSNRPNHYGNGRVAATAREKKNAIAWVMARQASGGTEMYSAIVEALRSVRNGAQRQVVLVSDGYVGGEEQIVTLLHESLPASCRMHVVGVGSAANRHLATSLARAGRGAEILVGLDDDAERSAKHLLDRTKTPVLTDVVIEGSGLVEQAPEHLPDVFAGAPLVAALAIRPEGGDFVVRGNLSGSSWEERLTVAPVSPGAGNPAIVKLFARERVADLEMRWTIGRDASAIDREIESIGMVFQIATRRTSWVAIDDDRSVDPRKGSREEDIPQELPYGTTIDSFGGPRAAFGSAMPMAAMAFSAAPAPRARSAPGAAGGAPPARSMRMPSPPATLGAPPPPPQRAAGIPSLDEGGAEEERTERRTYEAASGQPAPEPRRAGPAMASAPAETPRELAKKGPVAPEPLDPMAAPPPAAMPIPRDLAKPAAPQSRLARRRSFAIALVALFVILAAIVAWLLSSR